MILHKKFHDKKPNFPPLGRCENGLQWTFSGVAVKICKITRPNCILFMSNEVCFICWREKKTLRLIWVYEQFCKHFLEEDKKVRDHLQVKTKFYSQA